MGALVDIDPGSDVGLVEHPLVAKELRQDEATAIVGSQVGGGGGKLAGDRLSRPGEVVLERGDPCVRGLEGQDHRDRRRTDRRAAGDTDQDPGSERADQVADVDRHRGHIDQREAGVVEAVVDLRHVHRALRSVQRPDEERDQRQQGEDGEGVRREPASPREREDPREGKEDRGPVGVVQDRVEIGLRAHEPVTDRGVRGARPQRGLGVGAVIEVQRAAEDHLVVSEPARECERGEEGEGERVCLDLRPRVPAAGASVEDAPEQGRGHDPTLVAGQQRQRARGARERQIAPLAAGTLDFEEALDSVDPREQPHEHTQLRERRALHVEHIRAEHEDRGARDRGRPAGAGEVVDDLVDEDRAGHVAEH
jgi:hypothetical protein